MSNTDDRIDIRTEPARVTRGTRARTVALYVVYGLLSLLALSQARAWLLLALGSVPPHHDVFHAVTETPFKLLTLGGTIVLAATGGRSVVAAQALLVGGLCWTVTGLVVPEPDTAVWEFPAAIALSVTLLLGPWVLLSSQRRELLRLRPHPDRILLGVVAVSVVPSAMWLLAGIRIEEFDSKWHIVALAVTLPLFGLWAALRPHGRRWPAVTVGTAVVIIGLAGAFRPADIGSIGLWWGGAAIAAGALMMGRGLRPTRTG